MKLRRGRPAERYLELAGYGRRPIPADIEGPLCGQRINVSKEQGALFTLLHPVST